MEGNRVHRPALPGRLIEITCEWFALSFIAIAMIVCLCNRITEKEVRAAARGGARTPDSAYAQLGCEAQCGCCLDYAQEVIFDELGSVPSLRLVASRAA